MMFPVYSPPPHWPMCTSLHQGGGFGHGIFDAQEVAQRLASHAGNISPAATLQAWCEAQGVAPAEVTAELLAFHRESQQRVPPVTGYPEAVAWVPRVLQCYSELQRLTGLEELGMAVVWSLERYLLFRGRRRFGLMRPATPVERCRILLHLATDRGPVLIKNVDNPARGWRPAPSLPATLPLAESWWSQVEWIADGTGSGLHIEDEPEEIFPLPVLAMAGEYVHDTPGVVEFLRRYSPFLGGLNLLIFDQQLRLQALEKASYNYAEFFAPENDAWTHISGMVCRDPQSPQGIYQAARRREYLELCHLPDDGVEAKFWRACDDFEHMLVQGVRSLGARSRVRDIVELFNTPYPGGLNKGGYRFHPDQPETEYTLITFMYVLAENQYYRWQRGAELTYWPHEPEVLRYQQV